MNWHTLQRPLREALLEDDGDGGDCFRGEDRKKFFRKKKKKKFGAHRRRQTEDIKQLEMKYDFTHI